MIFSEKWLHEWVKPDLSTDELAHQLTMCGLEVEAVEAVAGAFSKVVVGQVLAVTPHPDADKLRVCQVAVGAKETLNIVCGAANVRQDLKVAVALVGAELAGDFKIKKSKLRGVPSHGMLCSASELGLAEQPDGLLELPHDAPLGTDLREYMQLDDVSIEIGLTPNRGDCLSVAGIAREVGVLSQVAVSEPEDTPVKADIDDTLTVSLKASIDCPRYAGRIIRAIDTVATTPQWMRERLRRSGLRSLGPVVDVTNYVLLELGQPMHAFDLGKLQGGITVRHAAEGESLTLLDGQSVDLKQGALLIADDKKPLALAGIMGGEQSAVSESTRDIFLESAFFDPEAIAGRARSYGLHTDSSHRFERGVSPDLQRRALERATQLLVSIVGGKVGPVCEEIEAANLPVRTPVELRAARIKRVLGIEIDHKTVEAILTRLGMSHKKTKQGWQITPPAFRFDISIEEDLIEELGRIYGYDNLPANRPQVPLQMPPQPESQVSAEHIKQTLVALGYAEAITYSFVDPELQQRLDPDQVPLALANPISSDMSVMRTSLWPGLIQALQYNLNRQQSRVMLFESGLKFVMQNADLKQEKVVAGILAGDVAPQQWGCKSRNLDFYDAKGHVEALLALGGTKEPIQFSPVDHPALHPGQAAKIQSGETVLGMVGALHPSVQQALGLSQAVFLFELNESWLQQGVLPKYIPLSRYPSIRRDIALLVEEEIPATDIMSCIEKAASDTLTNIELFDVYTGEGIDSGRKSLALGLTLQHLSRTLKESEVEGEIDQILGALKSKLGATLRE